MFSRSTVGRLGIVAIVWGLLLTACSGGSESTTTTAPVSTSTSSAPTMTMPLPSLPEFRADVVLHGGVVVTMDADSTVATGLAIADSRIVAVGDGEELLTRAPGALAVDLGGRTLIPGIIDPHIHLEQNKTPDLEAMLAEERMLVASGRTTLGVPAIIPFNLSGYDAVRDSGRGILRNHLYLSVNEVCGELTEEESWWRDYEFDRSAEKRITFAGIKVFADGGACNFPAFFEPIDGSTGDLYVSSERIAEVLTQANEEGALAVVHAIGDRAVTVALDGFAQALADGNPNRHRIDHNSVVPEDQIERYGEIGANFVGWSWFNSCLEQEGDGWDGLAPHLLPRLRTHRYVMEANPEITVSWHSDAPFSPVSIFEHLLSLTTFISLDAEGNPCEPPDFILDRVIDIATSLRMLTINAAVVMDLDSELGSIEVGKIADLAVLENNPLDQTGLELLDNRVVSTWIDGRSAFCDGWEACHRLPVYEAVAPPPPPTGVVLSASASRSGHGPDLVLDGIATGESFWSSGADAPGWIQADFAELAILEALRFTVFQSPPSDTIHILELAIGGSWVEVERFEGFTGAGDVLEWIPDAPVEGVEAFRMTTLESESWPEWYEIEIARS